MKKKGQASLEFLMTYGWAILVVMVVIGTLAYFGILNPSILLPEKCTFQLGLYCKDHRIDADTASIRLLLENGMGQGIIITRLKLGVTGGTIDCDVGIGNYTGLTPFTGCDGTDCTGCNETINYYQCNPSAEKKFAAEFNRYIGWRIPIGEQGNIRVPCIRMTQAEGKTKVRMAMVYFFDDSSPDFSHTMEGELLAKIETLVLK